MPATPGPVPIDALLAHSEWARALARRLVGELEADEVVQETWLAALRRPPEGGRPLRPWLGRVLGNVVRQRARGAGRRAAREQDVARDEALPSSAELSARAESQRFLIDALLELDEPFREVLLLRYFEGSSAAEIARRSGTPAGTIRWRLHEALDRLRARLDERAGGERGVWCAALAPLLEPRATALTTGLSTTILGGLSLKLLLTVSAVAGVLALALVITGIVAAPFGGGDSDLPRQEVAFQPLPRHGLGDEPAAGEAAAVERAPASPAPADGTAVSEPDGPHVALRFVDEAGAPVAGVFVVPSPRAGRERGESDRDGRVELALAQVKGARSRTLGFSHPGYANDARDARVEDGERADLGEVVLRAGGAASGLVVDTDGQPRPGVLVSAAGAERQLAAGQGVIVQQTPLGKASARTDANGHFRLEGLLAGDAELRAESDDGLWTGQSGPVEVRVGQESRGMTIVVEELALDRRIEGVVLDPAGAPVPRAVIHAHYKSWLKGGSTTALCDERGRFLVTLPWSGEWDLTARDGKQRWAEVSAADVEGGTSGLVLRFAPERTVALAVRAASGAALADWTAVVREEEDRSVLRVEAPTRLRVPNGRFTLTVSAPGHDEVELGPFEPESLATDAPLECTLAPLPGVRGQVTIDGAPAAGVEVGLYPLARGRLTCDGFPAWVEPAPRARAATDERGRFEITLRERGRYVLRAETETHALAELGPFDVDPAVGLGGLELDLTLGGAVEGVLTLADGRPGVGAFVAASRGDGHARCVRAGADGRYRIERLAPGRWFVTRVEHEILGGMPATSDDGTRAPHREVAWNCEVVDGVVTRFDLGREAPAASLNGALVARGVSFEGWTAELVPIDVALPSEVHTAELDTSGRFALELGSPGAYFLSLEAPGGVRFLEELALDGSAVEWRRELAFGRVELAYVGGDDATPRALIWEGSDGLFAFALLEGDANGEVVVDPVPAGRVRVAELDDPSRGEDPRGWSMLIELDVPAGGTARAELP